ncbi:MAG: glycosyltransferase [Bacteroidetes bacterium]|nr:glycosyltransferase [Bacteroidota bacterium]MBU1680115.1 glycosyltransferase [Bacteroidota bacterium]MBU2505725.1 glycosyltransferase [Bacteroidota bacterium]
MGIPKFTIITVCYNSAKTIERTILSVISQNYKNIEYIIIDGASTDNSLSIIDKYRNRIDQIVSEKDIGIYDAMNKGLKISTGDIIMFLNADDRLLDTDTIQHVAAKIGEFIKRKIEVFHGGVLMYSAEDGSGNVWMSRSINKYSIYRGAIPHPATFYLRNAFDKNGYFNTNYKICADYEWVVRGFIRNKLKFQNINIITSIFTKGGLSTNDDFKIIHREERLHIANNYFGKFEEKYYRLRKRFRKIF